MMFTQRDGMFYLAGMFFGVGFTSWMIGAGPTAATLPWPKLIGGAAVSAVFVWGANQ